MTSGLVYYSKYFDTFLCRKQSRKLLSLQIPEKPKGKKAYSGLKFRQSYHHLRGPLSHVIVQRCTMFSSCLLLSLLSYLENGGSTGTRRTYYQLTYSPLFCTFIVTIKTLVLSSRRRHFLHSCKGLCGGKIMKIKYHEVKFTTIGSILIAEYKMLGESCKPNGFCMKRLTPL